MPRRKRSKLKELGTDAGGRFFRNLGWIKSESGKYSQKKFYLGHDEDTATVAAAKLAALWKGVEKRRQEYNTDPISTILNEARLLSDDNYGVRLSDDGKVRIIGIGRPVWDALTLEIAEAIRNGHSVARISSKHLPGLNNGLVKCDQEAWLNRLRQDFSVIHIEIDDAKLTRALDDRLKQRGLRLQQESRELLAPPVSSQTLHRAIVAYTQYLRINKVDEDGETTEWGKVKIRQIEYVRKNSSDLDLSQVGGPSIDAIAKILAKRPITKNEKACSPSYARSCLKEFKAFLRWLDCSDDFTWSWPMNYEYVAPKVEISSVSVSESPWRKQLVQIFEIAELKTLYEYGRPIQRLYLLLGLNCGFGNAELTTLLKNDLFLRQQHPYDSMLNLNSTAADSWIVRIRTKTGVLGSWKLWPQTVAAIDWWLAERSRMETGYCGRGGKKKAVFETGSKGMLLITTAGKPIAEKNRRTGRIPNSWNALLKRVGDEHPNFKRLGFKYLRKTGSSLVRQESTGELASIYLAHGRPYREDKDLEQYANRPFGQLFDVLEIVHTKLQPLWLAVPDPFSEARKLGGKNNVSPSQIRQIKDLLKRRFRVDAIAKEVGVDRTTVYRHRKTTV